MELAAAILGILGRITEGASEAIRAARANNEEEAFAILEKALTDTADGLVSMRAKLRANREQAKKDLDAKFDNSGERDEDTKP